MAGFALSRVRSPGQKVVLAIIIATLILPLDAIAIPLLMVVTKLPWRSFEGGLHFEPGWLNSSQVQILPFVAGLTSPYLLNNLGWSPRHDPGPFRRLASWGYSIEPIDGGCRVAEHWQDHRPEAALERRKAISGVEDRVSHNEAGMRATLDRLANALE